MNDLYHPQWNKYGDDMKKPLGEVGFWSMLSWTQRKHTSHCWCNPAQGSCIKTPAGHVVGKNGWFTKGRNTVLTLLLNKITTGLSWQRTRILGNLSKASDRSVGTWFVQQVFVGCRNSHGPQYSFLGTLERVCKEKSGILKLVNIPNGLITKMSTHKLRCSVGLYKQYHGPNVKN